MLKIKFSSSQQDEKRKQSEKNTKLEILWNAKD